MKCTEVKAGTTSGSRSVADSARSESRFFVDRRLGYDTYNTGYRKLEMDDEGGSFPFPHLFANSGQGG
jgi:hypothetical protein